MIPSSFRHCNRSFFSLSPKRAYSDYRIPFTVRCGSTCRFSEDTTHLPKFTDADTENAFKNLMAASWDELPDYVKKESEKALSKNTNDEDGQNVLRNALRCAVNCNWICRSLVTVDESIPVVVENTSEEDDDESAKYASDVIKDLLHAAQDCYKKVQYALAPDGSEDDAIKDAVWKKIETELSAKWTNLKMRCSRHGFDQDCIFWENVSRNSGSATVATIRKEKKRSFAVVVLNKEGDFIFTHATDIKGGMNEDTMVEWIATEA